MKVEVLEPVTVTCLKGSIIEIAPAQATLLGDKVTPCKETYTATSTHPSKVAEVSIKDTVKETKSKKTKDTKKVED